MPTTRTTYADDARPPGQISREDLAQIWFHEDLLERSLIHEWRLECDLIAARAERARVSITKARLEGGR